jgi:hypothetical protein
VGREWARGVGFIGSGRLSGGVWAVALPNARARAGVMGGGRGDVWGAGISKGRHRRGKREGSSGRGLPGCVFRVLGFGVIGFKWAWGLVVFGEEERVQGGGFGWLGPR